MKHLTRGQLAKLDVEMRYSEAMNVYRIVPYAQAIERTGRPITSVDVEKARRATQEQAKEFNNGVDQAMYAGMRDVNLAAREQERRSTWTTFVDDSSSIMLRVDVHRPVQTRSWKCLMRTERKVCGCLVKAMNEASGVSMAGRRWTR